MCVHVNSLPDECLLPVFDLIPLFELLYLDQVCLRWATLLPSACARRRTLVLILGGDDIDVMRFEIPFDDKLNVSISDSRPYYDHSVAECEASLTLSSLLPNHVSRPPKSFDKFLSHDDNDDDDEDYEIDKSILPSFLPSLVFSGFFDILYQTDFTEMARLNNARLSGKLVTYFSKLFPNVKTLVVIHTQCYEDEFYLVVDLLKSWSLVTLKLFLQTYAMHIRYEDRPQHHPYHTLLQCINQQSSLQQLILEIKDGFFPITFPLETFSFIAQLKVVKLYFNSKNLVSDIIRQFDSPELRQIGFGYWVNPPDNILNDVLNPKYEFTTKVCQLYRDLDFETAEQFVKFCGRFTSLTTLRMTWSPDITFTKLVSNLALLKQLTYLKLHCYSPEGTERIFTLVDQIDEGTESFSLPQIKTLELVIYDQHHLVFETLSPHVFPSVEMLILHDRFHYLCHICEPESGRVYGKKANKCHRLLVRSLKTKFARSVRLYAIQNIEKDFVDWTEYETTEAGDLLEIGDD